MGYKRYSNFEIVKIIHNIRRHNNRYGRGGVAMVAEKYGISKLTLSNWLKKDNNDSTAFVKDDKDAPAFNRREMKTIIKRIFLIGKQIETRQSKLKNEIEKLSSFLRP